MIIQKLRQLIFKINPKLNSEDLINIKEQVTIECLIEHYKKVINLLEAMEKNPERPIEDFKKAIQDRLSIYEQTINHE